MFELAKRILKSRDTRVAALTALFVTVIGLSIINLASKKLAHEALPVEITSVISDYQTLSLMNSKDPVSLGEEPDDIHSGLIPHPQTNSIVITIKDFPTPTKLENVETILFKRGEKLYLIDLSSGVIKTDKRNPTPRN